ncbi:hypothetical protein EV360DRAFT_80936 [Lentinula raphanica]|nr:hypothetical protein EV360DRAFT_80936 [Lentinula raphanica]
MENQVTREGFINALNTLSNFMASKPIFQEYGQVRLIAFGGFNSVCYFGTRTSTYDLDYYTTGHVAADGVTLYDAPSNVTQALEDLIYRVAGLYPNNLHEDWANDRVTIFVDQSQRAEDIIRRSFQQNIIIYQTPQLVVYMGDLVFQLVQKLFMIKSELSSRNRRSDLIDATTFAAYFGNVIGRNMTLAQLSLEWPMHMAQVGQEEVDRVNAMGQSMYGRRVLDY